MRVRASRGWSPGWGWIMLGIVLGIEMSRLARSGREWHQLLGDLDGVYDPAEHNDRLVRHEVLRDRTEVKDHRRRAIAVVR
jgi:hypothetical protein